MELQTGALQSYVLQGTSMLLMQAGDSLINVLRIVGVLWLYKMNLAAASQVLYQ